jgi:hypothetical protein
MGGFDLIEMTVWEGLTWLRWQYGRVWLNGGDSPILSPLLSHTLPYCHLYYVKPSHTVTSIKSTPLILSPPLSQTLPYCHLYQVKPSHTVISIKSNPPILSPLLSQTPHTVTSIKSNPPILSPLLSQTLPYCHLLSQTLSYCHPH